MGWKYIKPLKDINSIRSFEDESGYCFCESFKGFIKFINGGRPSTKNVFCTKSGSTRILKCFLSFNENDRETIWAYNRNAKYIPFGVDNFGNTVCFDRGNDKVVFYNHETASVEPVADNFTAFIGGLFS